MDIRVFRKFIRKLEREIDSQFRGEDSCCGVSPVQCHTLLEIEDAGSTNINLLADSLSLNKSTVSRTVDSLYQLGMIHRDTDPKNRRSVIITLSETGEETCKRINTVCDSYYFSILENIPPEKIDAVNESIKLLTDIMIQAKQVNSDSCNCCVNKE